MSMWAVGRIGESKPFAIFFERAIVDAFGANFDMWVKQLDAHTEIKSTGELPRIVSPQKMGNR